MEAIVKEVLEKGSISIKSDINMHDYVLRVLDISDLSSVMKLQGRLIDIMEQKELYVPITQEEMVQLFEGAGEALGLYIDNNLYAACSLLSEVPYENNMARELNFSQEELFRVAQLELSLVDPDLRGHKLQYRMAGILANRLQKRTASRYLFTTVSPYNYPSIETVTSMGLYIAKLTKMYFGWDRFVVYRDFVNPVRLDTANTVIVSNTSFEEQQELLKNDYRGYSQFKDHDGIKIMYARML
ncbi:MAG: hypothetical protein PHD40_02130 [Syntrophomonadaceae bacterium]|nr:hypothetical protein [Syntrophomonadaceae bacterium]